MIREIRRTVTLDQKATNLWIKSCRRCGGDVQRQHDSYGWFLQCFQCSWTHDAQQFGTAGFYELETYVKSLFPARAACSTGNYRLHYSA